MHRLMGLMLGLIVTFGVLAGCGGGSDAFAEGCKKAGGSEQACQCVKDRTDDEMTDELEDSVKADADPALQEQFTASLADCTSSAGASRACFGGCGLPGGGRQDVQCADGSMRQYQECVDGGYNDHPTTVVTRPDGRQLDDPYTGDRGCTVEQVNADECPEDEGTVDEGTEDQGTEDEGTVDEGTEDQGTVDEGTVDEGTVDEGTEDDFTEDEGAEDEGAEDEGTVDEGTEDDGTVDEGTEEEVPEDEGN